MIDFRYLQMGLRGLANAHRAGTMAGHLGAAVVTAYFVGEDQSELPEAVFRGLEEEADRVIAGEEAIWWNAQKSGVKPADLFQALPEEDAEPEGIPSLALALSGNVGETRQSGHNVIFSSIAIRALTDHPQLATPTMVEGIRRLIHGFDQSHSGRGYYGRAVGWKIGSEVELEKTTDFPAYESLDSMIAATIDELIASAAIQRRGFGGMWHLINHAAAITELDRFGYRELARDALPAHHQHLRLLKTLPDVQEEFGPVAKCEHDPQEAIYWQGRLQRDEARLTHRIKTIYGFHTLMRLLEDARRREAARDAFRYLMA